ncbi:hypothetical protein GF373_14165, partial [bacterium]|nr:hypothetical protein [bacterium]
MKQKILVCWALATLLAISGSTQDAVGIFDGSTNIGDAAVEGIITYNEDDNLYSIDAAGTGVDDFQDSVFFIYQELSGNFSIECLPFPLAEGEGGLMIRENLEPGSPFAALMREMDGDVNPYFRTLPNQAMSSDGEFSADSLLDGTVRLERMGNSIHFYTLDADGAWDLEQTEILDLPDTLYVGLALSSGNNDTTTFYDFEFVSVEEYPFSINRDFGTDAPAPGEQLNITLTANSADVVNATVTEIIPQGSVIADLTADTGEILETEEGDIEWALPDFSGEATLTYTIDVPDRNIAIWRGTFTDGETVRDGDDLREGWIGGDLLVADSLEMQPRDTLSVHPEVPRFVEAEWGHLTGETQTYGLHLFPQSQSGILLHAVESSSSNILDSILEFNLNVQEAGTYYFFAQTRNEDNQSDSFFGGF